ncbi:MAG: hypothetical protein LBG48_05965 [Rickettsiales bacterium]|jgi:hypothetical protein|nr:hypothetical protein [Rickettsiales bacterium]
MGKRYNYTTISVFQETRENLRMFIEKHGFRTPDEFISEAINYFEVTGDDPREPKITAKMAIEKNNERLSQVIAFIRVFERTQMKPLLKDVEQATIEIRQAMESLSNMNKHISDQLGVTGKNDIISTTIFDEVEQVRMLIEELSSKIIKK